MRIFQVITVSEYGGAQTIVANLIKSLSPKHEVFVLYGGNGEAWSQLGSNFTRIKLCKHRKGVSWKDFFLLLKLFYYRIKYRPDVVHLHSSKMGALGRMAFNPKKIVYTVHGFDSIRKGYRKFLIVEQKLKDRAFRIVGVSKYDVNCLREEGISENVVRIYNAVTDNYITHSNEQDSITHELELIKIKYPQIVMCISRISKQKKLDLFLDVAKRMPKYAFVWIGNKETIPNLPENVFCLGEAHSASIYLRYADVFMLPSNYEGLPMSLLEALSFGVPIVASAVGGITEILDGKNGFSIVNKSYLFEEKIEYILSDNNVHNKMSEYAREYYLANFTIEKMVDAYTSIFNSIAEKKK
ncbi:glycosyltransferase [Dysgonomonas sp. ZJ709]|uniref:glycosyltransferase n=1 Tax=Dysgonomonas sp. ZJ709 TaxID=2709797 RepID=UPI0013EB8C0D|nr:glycosyltransferase [Dysgonomonas sp. ZJ709]